MKKKFKEIERCLDKVDATNDLFGGQTAPNLISGKCTEICVEYCPAPNSGDYLGNIRGPIGPVEPTVPENSM